MKRYLFMIVMFSALLCFAQDNQSSDLLNAFEEAMYPDNFFQKVIIETWEKNTLRQELEIDSYYKNGMGTLMTIESDGRSKGIRFLEKDDNLWMYNPKTATRKPVRLSPRDSFQGSLFSNNDIGDSRYSDDYESKLVGHGNINHPDLGTIDCYEIEAKAKSKDSTYDTIKLWGQTGTNLPIRIQYFTKSGLLFKELEFFEFKTLAGRKRASRLVMNSKETEGSRSVVKILEMEEKNDIPDSYFTEAYLKK
ncbi:MAG: outer membrane lipoprotein-sorting protein [Spirochaetales bacterium]|nr:outer membrane lipoprotein-sorting protein [Spirochaetales bacterium]